MSAALRSGGDYVDAIRKSGLTIYDPVEVGSKLWIPSHELESILDGGLRGFSTAGLKIRTRSKVVKTRVCELLGYPIPKTFKKVQPRFTGQNFDTYVQGSNNLQIWNEELTATRRYVLVREGRDATITRVKVVTGDALAALDTTGTLTKKYQAQLIPGVEISELISPIDTERVVQLLATPSPTAFASSPTDYPEKGRLIPISVLYERLKPLLGKTFIDAGNTQERNRGAGLHRLICTALGYPNYRDNGQMPDVLHQLLEAKLQTSPTIDLGLGVPSSTEVLEFPQVDGIQIRYCDVRYAIFDAVTDGAIVKLRRFYLTTGRDFFGRFRQFAGKVLNAKLQIPLPRNFFGEQPEGGTNLLL